jgi:[acyl-carrier-protein] S-malonyltransferase
MSCRLSAAILFPGQGAHNISMLNAVRQHKSFPARYASICNSLGFDPLAKIRAGDAGLINANAVSSLFTVLASVIAFDEWRRDNQMPRWIAGYSVGQFTALYASGAISYEQLIRIVTIRASMMDKCALNFPGSMIAVIGVPPDSLEEFCLGLRNRGMQIFISNFNCHGQYTLAGTALAIKISLNEIIGLRPKKIVLLPTSGAWHCPLMDQASKDLYGYLEGVNFNDLKIPVIDNVSGEFLPVDKLMLMECLSKQVNHPVQWEKGVRNILSHGCSRFIEIGFGNILTKFGFFIERTSVDHKAFYPNMVDI